MQKDEPTTHSLLEKLPSVNPKKAVKDKTQHPTGWSIHPVVSSGFFFYPSIEFYSIDCWRHTRRTVSIHNTNQPRKTSRRTRQCCLLVRATRHTDHPAATKESNTAASTTSPLKTESSSDNNDNGTSKTRTRTRKEGEKGLFKKSWRNVLALFWVW